ncbi:MAG: hypothetical protein EBR02_04065 [Alphaproteobacteria bacterium]|nr:hypothetical protein [Alphaproteobacteria bacterium]
MKKQEAIDYLLKKVDVYARFPLRQDTRRYDVKLLNNAPSAAGDEHKEYYAEVHGRLEKQLNAMPASILRTIAEHDAAQKRGGVQIVVFQGNHDGDYKRRNNRGLSSKERRALLPDVGLRANKFHADAFSLDLDGHKVTARYRDKTTVIAINAYEDRELKAYPKNSKVYNGLIIHELAHYYLDHCIPPDQEKKLIDSLNKAVNQDQKHISPHTLKVLRKPGSEFGMQTDTRQEYFCRLLTQICGANMAEDERQSTPYFTLAKCPHVCNWIGENFPDWLPKLTEAMNAQAETKWQASVRAKRGGNQAAMA